MDTLPEVAFDEATQLAARVCQVPIAAIKLVDRDRQWSKSAAGQDKNQDSRDVSFCAHAILLPDLMVVPDARGDHRFFDNPLVTGEPDIRFYAGAPLLTSERLGLSSLCIVDRVPRQLTDEQAAILRLLAHQVVARIEFQRYVALQSELILDRERLLGQVHQAAERQRVFLGEVLHSVTGGRLRLCQQASELPRPAQHKGKWVRLSVPSDIRKLRQRAREAAVSAGFSEARWNDLVTAVSEAAMNAVVQGGGGRGRVCGGAATLQVQVEDHGCGIDVDRLPRATLERGYTTAGTLGHGMKMMLDTVDRVFLLTGQGGTTVVMEQDREPPIPSWLSNVI